MPPALSFVPFGLGTSSIRTDRNVTVIPYAGHEFKSLFGDDALLTLTNPRTTLPNVSLDSDLVARLQSHFPFRWATTYIDYLGVWLTTTYSSIFPASYYPLVNL